MLPIKKVVVMEDRAQVERAGSVAVNGVTKVEITGLSLVAVDRSLRVEVKGATLLEAKLERRWKEVPFSGLPSDSSETRKRVEELRLKSLEQADVVQRLDARAEVLVAARADLLRSISELTGHGTSNLQAWREQLADLSQRQLALDEERRAVREALAVTQQRHRGAQQALNSEGPRTKHECILVLRLDGTGEAQVRASYLVPAAVWRPAYRATLTGAQVTVEAEAVVWQHTGEEWTDVELAFSTARPTLGTTPPSLEEDVLYLRAKQQIEKRVVDVTIREEAIQSAGEGGGSPEMPGLDDGGETRLLKASSRTTVRNDGQPQRVALFSFTSQALVERVCPAEL
ncbi:MAG: mucoidy inhibitor MuiA family protein, partial [Archangium sp.]